MKNNVDQIKALFYNQGLLKYGENITQTEHAVQCWMCAKNENAPLFLRAAAFLHDIGHLLYEELEVKSPQDLKHEVLGAQFLNQLGVNSEVTELILSHVWAKRYLVTQNPAYLNTLSDASKQSFILQGGILSDSEMLHYSQLPNLNDCLLLRKWDDLGKNEFASNVISEEIWLDVQNCFSN